MAVAQNQGSRGGGTGKEKTSQGDKLIYCSFNNVYYGRLAAVVKPPLFFNKIVKMVLFDIKII